ncbi:MAG: alpha/beta hydrolase [Gammaproteobacteria bacterium]|nr:alpha/beta hydrolase [Gammaproteobacteria bacterium]
MEMIKWLIPLILLLMLAGWYLWTPDRPIDHLERHYLRSADDYVHLPDITLHVRDDGLKDAPVLVLLHGLGSSLHTWEHWTESLKQQYRVIALDLPGFGLTGPDPTGDYGDERSIRLLLALLERLEIKRATLIGNSLGGRIAWRFAAAHPERVDKLVLISPDGFASPGFDYQRKPDIPAVMQLMQFVLPKFLLRMNLSPAYADARTVSDELVTRYHDLLLYPGNRAAVVQRLQQVYLLQPQPLLQQIRAPVLLLWGEQDAVIPISNADDYMAALAYSHVHRLPSVGHLPHEEAPQQSLLPVLEFLQSKDPRSPVGRPLDQSSSTVKVRDSSE